MKRVTSRLLASFLMFSFFKYNHSFFNGYRFYRHKADKDWSDLAQEAEYGNALVIKKEKYFLFSYPKGSDKSGYEEIDFMTLNWRVGANCPFEADKLLISKHRQECPSDIVEDQFLTKFYLE